MINEQLIKAYQNTRYIVINPPIIILIGQSNDELEKLLNERAATTWAFITAYNPSSNVLAEAENIKRHDELVNEVSSYTYFEGAGAGEDEYWKPEKSLLILGIKRNDAISIGNKFGQNAIVYGIKTGNAELLLLK